MKESTFLYHEPCPNCHSRDNVGVWSDGSKFCFGRCGYIVRGGQELSLNQLQEQLNKTKPTTKGFEEAYVDWPSDVSPVFPPVAHKWLANKGITMPEKAKYRLQWSERAQAVIIPICDRHQNLLFYQRKHFDGNLRYFNVKQPPQSFETFWWTSPNGVREFFPRGDYCVVVEDFVSAIKVGRRANTTCLFGSNLNKSVINCLSLRFKDLVIWLDKDKIKEALRFKWMCLPHFRNVFLVFTEYDPKEYDDAAIANYLTRATTKDTGTIMEQIC